MSSLIAASPQHRTTSSSPNRGRQTLRQPPEADHVSFNQEQVGKRYGYVKVISPERRYRDGWTDLYVEAQCVQCDRVGWFYLRNLQTGASSGCKSCFHADKYGPKWLQARVRSMVSRCQKTNDAGYRNYGGRGVQFLFSSVNEACQYIMRNLGLHQHLQLDRVDNNGHYAPGNLRYVSRKTNNFNKRTNKMTEAQDVWAKTLSPLAYNTTKHAFHKGATEQDIIKQAQNAVAEKRKNWRGIRQRLEELGYTT